MKEPMQTSRYPFNQKQPIIKVLIVDDHNLVLEGLCSLLASHEEVKVVAAVDSGKKGLAYLKENPVNIVLLDINLPDIKGMEVCEIIDSKFPNAKVIALSTYNSRSIVNQMISNGAKGYLLKNVGTEELKKAVVTVAEGGCYYDAEIQKTMADTIFNTMHQPPRLTKREKQIIKLIVEGKTTANIADELFISPLTVETHRRNIMKKLKISNVAALVRVAMDKMLI